MKTKDILIIIGVIAASVVLYFMFSDPGISSVFDNFGNAMYYFVVNNPSSAYLGAFIISTFGNFTVFLPIPYALAVILLGAQPFIEPLILAVVCGFGSAIGELSAYAIGWGGRKFIEKKYSRSLNSMKVIIERYGFAAIVLFAATPLPDDMLLIPLGVLKYNLYKTLVASILGKTMLCAVLAYGGRFSWSFIEFIFTGSGAIGTVIGIVGTVLLVYVMFRLDWEQILNPPSKVSSNKSTEDLINTQVEPAKNDEKN
ncbi:MAG: YqaA family protein [Candidatus Odinarchaeia archaeon]